MAIKDIFKVSRKTYFNPSAWIGADEIKQNTTTIVSLLKTAFTSDKAQRSENFQQAMQRQGITEQSLSQIAQKYLLNALVFAALAIVSFLASFYYLLHHNTVAGWMLCIAVTVLFCGQAFRFHFWYFQIKHRKLGCTLREWWQGKIED